MKQELDIPIFKSAFSGLRFRIDGFGLRKSRSMITKVPQGNLTG
jgi:hypothetical protein